MKIRYFIFVQLTMLIFCQFLQSGDTTGVKPKKIANKKISITFDNLPSAGQYSDSDRVEINAKILQSLKKYQIKATGFVLGDNISGDWELIIDWLIDGHTIGFMTHSGQDVENVPLDIFISDIKKGSDIIEDILQTYKQKKRYFRYPFLHYGSRPEARKKIADILASQNIKTAYASIVTEDFVYNMSFEKSYNSRDSLRPEAIKREYLEHIIERLAHAESDAQEVAGRPIRHILQLRANRLNAWFLDDILAIFEERGYNFVSLEHSLNDKIYKKNDNYYGLKSLSFLERLKISK